MLKNNRKRPWMPGDPDTSVLPLFCIVFFVWIFGFGVGGMGYGVGYSTGTPECEPTEIIEEKVK